MTFGETLQSLRRGAKMTQEELAELLFLSPQAVSRWETGASMPDISLLPSLVRIFHVTADYLLGLDAEEDSEQLERYLEEARQAGNNAQPCRRTAILREALRQFPGSYKVMERLADALACEYSRRDVRDYGEVFRLCRRILAECTDSELRSKALRTMGVACGYAGETQEMHRIAQQMIPMEFSREVFLLWHMQGDAGLAQRQAFLSELVTYLVETIGLLAAQTHDSGGFVYPREERMQLWQQEVALIELLFPDGDYHIFAQEAEQACGFLASAYLRAGDRENGIFWLRRGADFAFHFDTYAPGKTHTSPALRGYCSGGWIRENGMNHSAYLVDYLTGDPETEEIRQEPKVQEILRRAKEIAQKPS